MIPNYLQSNPCQRLKRKNSSCNNPARQNCKPEVPCCQYICFGIWLDHAEGRHEKKAFHPTHLVYHRHRDCIGRDQGFARPGTKPNATHTPQVLLPQQARASIYVAFSLHRNCTCSCFVRSGFHEACQHAINVVDATKQHATLAANAAP